MSQTPYDVPDDQDSPERARHRKWAFRAGDLCELIALAIYLAIDFQLLRHLSAYDSRALWTRYGDTSEYWNSLFAYMHDCRLMILQPIGVLILWVICVWALRGELRSTTVFAAIVIVIVECVNYFCFGLDAFGFWV
jgi:hypothetical protein